ncbi:hypothetical protein ACJX0J_034515, partial [Zea mays]
EIDDFINEAEVPLLTLVLQSTSQLIGLDDVFSFGVLLIEATEKHAHNNTTSTNKYEKGKTSQQYTMEEEIYNIFMSTLLYMIA